MFAGSIVYYLMFLFAWWGVLYIHFLVIIHYYVGRNVSVLLKH